MPRYVISYIGGEQPADAEQGRRNFARYRQWLDALGDAAVSPANPLGNTRTISPDGSVREGGMTAMSGFTIVAAESMEAALTLARGCPFLEIGGSLEVSELMEMPNPK